jgi:peptidoglycan/xylan/chitin deacetylase (PgdA/CDA1 family)
MKKPIVLAYHSVPKKAIGYYDVAAEHFERQLEYLKRNYDLVTVDSLVDDTRHNPNDRKPKIALTFDDGYENHYSIVYPLLKKHRTPAVFFITTEYVAKKGMLDWNQIIEMARNPFVEIGCHSYSHPDLTSLSVSAILEEVKTSKEILEEQLKQKVELFAYPGGCYNNDVKKIVEFCGYRHALTGLVRFRQDDPYEIRRIWLCSKTQELNYFIFWMLRALLTDMDEYQTCVPKTLDEMLNLVKER